jgi:hypothetical protein
VNVRKKIAMHVHDSMLIAPTRRMRKKSSQQFAALTKQQQQIKEQQCGESKRIIFSKRKRNDLTAGEQQDLQRFIHNYKERVE